MELTERKIRQVKVTPHAPCESSLCQTWAGMPRIFRQNRTVARGDRPTTRDAAPHTKGPPGGWGNGPPIRLPRAKSIIPQQQRRRQRRRLCSTPAAISEHPIKEYLS
jgi:hypothetical protein